MVDRETLAQADLLGAFGPEALDRLLAASGDRTMRRNDVLFQQGDPANEVYVVRSGRIAVGTRSADGRDSVIKIMERGDIFGEMPLFDGLGRSADARALEPTTILVIPYSVVRSEIEADPNLLWAVVDLLSRRIRLIDAALADAVFLDVTGRTAKRLLELAGEQDEFQLPITQEELAGLAGASRERVNKALASFIRLGWIAQDGRRYRITNRAELTQRAR